MVRIELSFYAIREKSSEFARSNTIWVGNFATASELVIVFK